MTLVSGGGLHHREQQQQRPQRAAGHGCRPAAVRPTAARPPPWPVPAAALRPAARPVHLRAGQRRPGRATPAIHPAGQLAQPGQRLGRRHRHGRRRQRREAQHRGRAPPRAPPADCTAPPPGSPAPTAPRRPGRTPPGAAPAAASASASRGGTRRRRRAALQRGASVSSAPGGQDGQQEAVTRGPARGRRAPAAEPPSPAPGRSDLRRPVAEGEQRDRPQAAARSTLGIGRHTTTKPSVSAPPSSAVVRRGMPSRGARPRRSTCWARPGGPMSKRG